MTSVSNVFVRIFLLLWRRKWQPETRRAQADDSLASWDNTTHWFLSRPLPKSVPFSVMGVLLRAFCLITLITYMFMVGKRYFAKHAPSYIYLWLANWKFHEIAVVVCIHFLKRKRYFHRVLNHKMLLKFVHTTCFNCMVHFDNTPN